MLCLVYFSGFYFESVSEMYSVYYCVSTNEEEGERITVSGECHVTGRIDRKRVLRCCKNVHGDDE